MAGNKKIFDLPLRTGVTADDRLVIVDSGNTTTYSVKLSDLQDGTGVNSLDSMTGDIVTAAGPGIEITSEFGEININNLGVLSLEGLSGDLFLSGGTNITITDNGTDTISIEAAGGGGGVFIAADGTNNVVSDYYATSDINSGATESVIIGGSGNTITTSAPYSSIFGGQDNNINNLNVSFPNTIIGSTSSEITNTNQYGSGVIIAGGYDNIINNSGYGTAVIGGWLNETKNLNAWGGITAGGTGNYSSGRNSGVFAGDNNDATQANSVVIGGQNNTASGIQGFIIGGENNSSAASYNGVLGGNNNTAPSSRGGIVFGSNNNCGQDGYTFASFNFSNTSLNNPSKPVISIGGTNNVSNVNNNGYITFLNGVGNKIYAAGGSGQHNIYGGTSNWISASGTYASPSGAGFTGNTNTILNSKNSNIENGVLNTIIGSDGCVTSATTRATIIGLSGYTATSSDMVYVPALNVVNYASLDFPDDATAAANGVQLGELYHTLGVVKIRIV